MPSQSFNTAAVCSPNNGGAVNRLTVDDIAHGGPTTRIGPETG